MAKLSTEMAHQPTSRRYRTVAEIKRDFFPIAAAEERSELRRRSYDSLVAELFEQKRASVKK
jgi:hypothetical protein